MEANKRRYTELVGGSVQFVIPVFQRDYKWGQEHCQQLWDDIQRVAEGADDEEHFFGPVVYVSTEGQSAAFTKWLLIDGQQRMTTVMLLMIALRDFRSSRGDEKGAGKIEHDFLVNTYESERERGKLVLRDRDEAVFRWLVERDHAEQPIRSATSNLKRNYNFLYDKLQNANIDTLVRGVGRLAVVDVRLDHDKDNPQQIFESLNSTGMDLAQADLVRNYVLMGLEEGEQTSLYRKYWKKMEGLYAGSDSKLDNFIRDFVSLEMKAQKQGRIDQVYASFRSAFEDRMRSEDKLRKLLKRMLRFARFHAAFTMNTGEFSFIADDLRRIHSLHATPAILIVRLLDAYALKYLSSEGLSEALHLLESYLVRRDVCGSPTRSYWQQFAKLAYALRKTDVLGRFKVNLYWLSNTAYAFPSDVDFQHALEESSLYVKKVCRFVLNGLENGDSRERTDTTTLSVEHIMPQNEKLSREWRKMLGSEWKEVQDTWLHRLGNLTLTAYNQELSDRPFPQKRDAKDGFKKSPLRLNQLVGKQREWTVKQMSQRGKVLGEEALRIWPALTVTQEQLRRVRKEVLTESSGELDQAREEMNAGALGLFDNVRDKIMSLRQGTIEVVSPKSVSYYTGNSEFFAEVLPRSYYLLVLLAIDASEVESDLDIHDTADRKFLANARNDGGCFVEIFSEEQVGACEVLLKQSLTAAGN